MRIVIDEYESNLWLPLCNIKLLLQKTNNSLNHKTAHNHARRFAPCSPPSSVAGRLNLDVMSLTQSVVPIFMCCESSYLVDRSRGG